MSSFDCVVNAGPPARPLSFPTPIVHDGYKTIILVRDYHTGDVLEQKQGLMIEKDSKLAFSLQKKLAKTAHGGAVYLAVKLEAITESDKTKPDAPETDVQWETKGELVVIKKLLRVQNQESKTTSDSLSETAALQHVGNYHPHVLGCHMVLQDTHHHYIVMHYCAGGDLYSKIQQSLRDRGHCQLSPNELQARVWFRQLTQALEHLQTKGVCHLNITLEHLLIDEHNSLQLIGFGQALRVPYSSKCNAGTVSDVSDGSCRRLMDLSSSDPGFGNADLMYLAPERIARLPLDGYACDLWSAGIVLFILLVDMAPFRWAHESDPRYCYIAHGHMKELLETLDISVSDDACDLLQNMLWHDPRKRLSLAQVMKHPWVTVT